MQVDLNHHVATFEPSNDAVDSSPLSLAEGVYTFEYTYPLSEPATFEHPLTPASTVNDILTLARADYERIYAEEDATSAEPPEKDPALPLLNRAKSHGKYGIWGHDLADLVFECLWVSGMNVSFDMESQTLLAESK